MELRDFLIRTHICCQKIGGNSRNIADFLMKYQRFPKLGELEELLSLKKVSFDDYIEYFLKDELTDEIERNKKYSKIKTILDDDYPALLKEISDGPAVFFYLGDYSLIQNPSLAVVGARNNTIYSKKVIDKLLPAICTAEIVTVSGLAHGVDHIVHETTLELQGKTIGIIGTGLNIAYPKKNTLLQEQVAHDGLLISEYCLDQKPLAFHFPHRNRIIAGISNATLVVEAKKKSGSLITANLALQYNRDVYAVPGNIDSPLSDGCNELIQAGAKAIVDASDILEEYISASLIKIK